MVSQLFLITAMKKNQQNQQLLRKQKQAPTLQNEIASYQFLRNTWGRYFCQRDNMNHQDKLDSINKVVGIIKAQVKILTIREEEKPQPNSFSHIQQELRCTKQCLQRSNMQKQQAIGSLARQQELVTNLYTQNQNLKKQLVELKKSKNQAQQKIIDLSKKIYDLQKAIAPKGHSSFDQLYSFSQSQIKNEKTILIQKNKITKLFDDKDEDLCISDDQKEIQELKQIVQNLPFPKNTLKFSTQIQSMRTSLTSRSQRQNVQKQFHKAKQQAQRMMQLQMPKTQGRGSSLSQKSRKQLKKVPISKLQGQKQLCNEGKPQLVHEQAQIYKQRRFKRIR